MTILHNRCQEIHDLLGTLVPAVICRLVECTTSNPSCEALITNYPLDTSSKGFSVARLYKYGIMSIRQNFTNGWYI
jgi:hypothetical protein